MDDKLITIAEFESNLDAQMAKASLESSGIKAMIVGENIHGLLPADGMLNVELKVLEENAREARIILDSEQSQLENQQEDS